MQFCIATVKLFVHTARFFCTLLHCCSWKFWQSSVYDSTPLRLLEVRLQLFNKKGSRRTLIVMYSVCAHWLVVGVLWRSVDVSLWRLRLVLPTRLLKAGTTASASVSYFDDSRQTNYLKMYRTDLRAECSQLVELGLHGRRWSVWNYFMIPQWTLPWQPIFVVVRGCRWTQAASCS